MNNCTCGGCDRCLHDQGLLTDAEISARTEAREVLRNRLISMSQRDRKAFDAATCDSCASNSYFTMMEDFNAAAVAGDQIAIAAVAARIRDLLVGDYVADNLDRTVKQIHDLRGTHDAEWAAYMRRAA